MIIAQFLDRFGADIINPAGVAVDHHMLQPFLPELGNLAAILSLSDA
jgi:hypothetical protein